MILTTLVKSKSVRGTDYRTKLLGATGKHCIDVPVAMGSYFTSPDFGGTIAHDNITHWNRLYRWAEGSDEHRVFSCISLDKLRRNPHDMASLLVRLINLWSYLWPYTGEYIEDTLVTSSDMLDNAVAGYRVHNTTGDPVLFIWHPKTKTKTIIGIK